MKERGMLFSAPMMRANMAGIKTQTRRAMKPQPQPNGTWNKARNDFDCLIDEYPPSATIWNGGWLGGDVGVNCTPYGCVGDRIWARETHAFAKSCNVHEPFYRADGEVAGRQTSLSYIEREGRWRPSIHMPRWASRFTAEITGVRAEPLQGISEEDAIAEGVTFDGKRWNVENIVTTPVSAVDAYRALWDWVNGRGSWDLNPWVWVIEYAREPQ